MGPNKRRGEMCNRITPRTRARLITCPQCRSKPILHASLQWHLFDAMTIIIIIKAGIMKCILHFCVNRRIFQSVMSFHSSLVMDDMHFHSFMLDNHNLRFSSEATHSRGRGFRGKKAYARSEQVRH